MLFPIVAISTLIVIIFLFVEKKLYERNIESFNVRVLVTGTRGKSNVTELIIAALQSSGTKTAGKITGIVPSVILPDGTKKIIRRLGTARVQEQIKFVNFAALYKPDAIVLECMSIQPELQKLESRLFKPHIHVITNIRNDHQEELGFELASQAEAITLAIPPNSKIVTNEKRFIKMINSVSNERKSEVYTCEDKIESSQSKFGDCVAENAGIAMKVCELLDVSEQIALNSIYKTIRERNSLFANIKKDDVEITFINAFAANDVLSTKNLLREYENKYGSLINPCYILNTRADRPYRTIEFSKWLCNLKNISRIYLIGNHSLRAKRELINGGIHENEIKILKENILESFSSEINMQMHKNLTFIGIGNVAKDGFNIVDQFFPRVKLESVRL